VSKTLWASTGTWAGGTDTPVYSYQWTRNGVDIPGATAINYTVSTADIGATLAVRVTAMNIAGSVSVAAAGRPVTSSTYYVSTATGNDSWSRTQALSPSTPWKTIQQAATQMVAGDTCLIESGTYPETVTVSTSGSANFPITFQPDAGQTVVISGADAITGWTLESPNIYYAPMSWTMGDGNQVFVSGTMVPEARWPNAGSTYPWQNSLIYPSPDWSYMQAAGYTTNIQLTSTTYSNNWFSDSNLPSRADNYWAGATAHVVSGWGWVQMNAKVLTSTGDTLFTDDTHGPVGGAYAFTGTSSGFNGNEYYLSGIKGEMDSAGEWYYCSSNSRLYIYSTTTPANVQAKHRPYGFVLTGHPYIQLVNLNFFGCTIQTDSGSTNETLNGLSMLYLAYSNVSPWGYYALTLHDGSILRNSVLAYNAQGLLTLSGSNIKVINNNIHDSGYMADADPAITSGTITYGALISHNTISNTGHSALAFPGRAGIVEFNDMSNAMRLLSDGGILYSNGDAGNTIVRYNLLHDSPGPIGHLGWSIQGFYLDCYNSNWIFHHNIIWNVPGASIQLNARCNFNMIFNNTCANIGWGGPLSGFNGDGVNGMKLFNNLLGTQPTGNMTNWAQTDLRYDLYTDPGFISGTFQISSTNAQVVNQGAVIPGITDGYLGAAPDLGAIESGSADWTSQAGYSVTPPSPDPVYTLPGMVFANQIQDGSFESGTLAGRTVSGSVSLLNADSWVDTRVRTGNYGLQFGLGTSEVSQVVTGLKPNRRYKFYAGTQTGDTYATVKLGVRNYGNPAVEVVAPVTGTGNWIMNSGTFFTNSTGTSAQIYLNVTSVTGTLPVYADDFAVEWEQPAPPASVLDPIFQYTLNQSSGSIATDSGTGSLSGTIKGTVAWGSGVTLGGTAIYTKALTCNGTNTYVLTPSIAIPGEITISCWAMSGSSGNWSSNWGTFFCDTTRSSFLFGPSGSSRTIYLTVFYPGGTSDGRGWTAPAGFDITQWHHYAATISSANRSAILYVDGSNVNSMGISGSMNVSTEAVHIAHDTYSSSRCLYGRINDARIYNQALTPSQIQGLAMAGTDISLKLHLAFDESSGTPAAWDSSGYGNKGTLVNTNTATAWGSGIVNGAITLNGSNGCVTTSTMTTPGEVSMTCWARSNTASSPHVWDSYGSFFCQTNSIVFNPVQGSTGIVLNVYYMNSGTLTYQAVPYTPPAGFDITQWHHYGATVSWVNKQATLYVDGIMVYQVPFNYPLNATTAPIYIGHDTYSSSRYFNGQMDDARLYSRILSWSEMLELSEEFNGPPYY